MTAHVKPGRLEAGSPKIGPAISDASNLITRIGRTYRFESAHHLPHLPDGHRSRNMHGHNYRIEVVLSGIPDSRGFVMDFAEIDAEIMPLIRKVDHRLLNEVEGLENPTAEIIANWFFQRIRSCERARVYENDECWAEVSIQQR